MSGFESKRQASKDLLQPAVPNPWREAIDAQLFCLHLGTVDSFLDAGAALNALINWHVETALDPAVSAYAQALIDRGAAATVPAVPPEVTREWVRDLVKESGLDWHRGFAPLFDGDDTNRYEVLVRAALAAAPVQSAARAIAEEQSYDTGLWFVATTATEAHLQAALRRLTDAVEGEALVARTPLTDAQMDQIMHDCGLSVTARDIARAVEQAHGIGSAA